MGNFDGDSGTVFEQSYATTNRVNGKLPNGGGAANGTGNGSLTNGRVNFNHAEEPQGESEPFLNQRKFSAPAYTEIRTRRCNANAAAEAKVSRELFFWLSEERKAKKHLTKKPK